MKDYEDAQAACLKALKLYDWLLSNLSPLKERVKAKLFLFLLQMPSAVIQSIEILCQRFPKLPHGIDFEELFGFPPDSIEQYVVETATRKPYEGPEEPFLRDAKPHTEHATWNAIEASLVEKKKEAVAAYVIQSLLPRIATVMEELGLVPPRPIGDSKNKGGTQQELQELKEKLHSLGFSALEGLNEVQRYRLIAIQHLRENHGLLKVNPNTLHTLNKEMKQETRDYLNVAIGNNPRAKQIIDDVLRKPKKSRGQDYNGWMGKGPESSDNSDLKY
jgi:hypothetical protein